MVGLRIAPGWVRQIKSRVGGVKGCTHLRELMSVLATVAFQTQASYARQLPRLGLDQSSGEGAISGLVYWRLARKR